jgi:hypothetical protein
MAEQGVSRLEATLHQIEIRGGAELAAIEGIVVEVQGRTVASSLLAASIPVDPGPWKIDVRAPDGRVGSATVSVPDAAGTTPLTLELRPIDQPAPSSDGVSGLTIAGIIVTSVGATAMLTGGIVFGVASGAYPSQCEGAAGEFDPVECPETALRDEANDARGLGDVGGIVFWSGLGVAATGVVLLLIPALADDSSSAARVVPWVGPTQAGASVTVAF